MKSLLIGATTCLTLLLSGMSSIAWSTEHDEADYVEKLAKTMRYGRETKTGYTEGPARTQVRLQNDTICDIIATGVAIEVEFAPKWAESIGQSLSYAESTGLSPVVILLLREPADARFIRRILPVAERADIKVWVYHVEEIMND